MIDGLLNFPLFLVTGIILNITPGQDTFYIISRTLGQGIQGGIISVLGISTGAVVHTLLTAFGLSAVIARLPAVMMILQYGGGAYLIYLGLAAFFSLRKEVKASGNDTTTDAMIIFRQGFITNLLNPKILLFFLTFLPRFIKPEAAANPVPYLVLGGTFICTGTAWCILLALFTGLTGKFFFKNSNSASILTLISGTMLTGLGVSVFIYAFIN